MIRTEFYAAIFHRAGARAALLPTAFRLRDIRGQMRLTSADGVREVELKTGASYSSEGVDWHEVLNIGTTTVTYLIVEQK